MTTVGTQVMDCPLLLTYDPSYAILIENLKSRQFRDKLIMDNLRMALRYAAHFWYKMPRRSDEIKSAAVYGLIVAVNKAGTCLKDTNIIPYIKSYIRGEIKKAIVYECFSGFPISRKNYYKGKIQAPTRNSLPVLMDRQDHEAFYDLQEVLTGAIKTEEERIIMNLFEEGYNLVEIGEKIGKSKSYVWNKRTLIQSRIERLSQ